MIHATRDVDCTMRNIRKLLREGGNIDIMEQTQKNRIITFIFGVVKGFWHFEDKVRQDHCILTPDKWELVLKTAGFQTARIFPAFRNRHGYIIGWAGPETVPPKTAKPATQPHWIIFTDPGLKVGNYLCDKLSSCGREIIQVVPSVQANVRMPCFAVRNDRKEDFDKLLEKVTTEKLSIEGVVFLWALDKARITQSELLQPFLYLAQMIPSLKQKIMPRVFAVTEGIVPVDENDLSHFYPSTLWGFVKAMRNEHTDINSRIIGLPVNFGENEMQELFFELWADDPETQVGYFGGSRYVARFQPAKNALQDLPLPTGTDRFQLVLPETKSISDLQFGPLDPFNLEENEVEIHVKASALNFRDVFRYFYFDKNA